MSQDIENWVLFGYRYERDNNGVEAEEGTPTFIAVAVERGASEDLEIVTSSNPDEDGGVHGEVTLRVPGDADVHDIRQALMNVADEMDVQHPRVHFEPEDTHALVELTQWLWKQGVINEATFEDVSSPDAGPGAPA